MNYCIMMIHHDCTLFSTCERVVRGKNFMIPVAFRFGVVFKKGELLHLHDDTS